ncbi:glycosyltransferase [Roseovarius sp. MMSF_3281]|uniref:glycosyltransferase n=1 Tax=Roseovarius sp. MMSF_3281 TaxID=3046694 RepID=UPI00273F678A|nr:glycosyltransferase [Roseovarius sp. MMSF_3281]
MRVVGLCRFSYPALGGFKRMHDTVEDREAYLYQPERMNLRFNHFETLTLPSIAAQRDPRFSFLVVIGPRMPKPYLDRLHDITAGVEQIKIVAMEPVKHRYAMQAAIKEELGEDTGESLQFRLDDDDAVGVNFVRAIRRMARQAGNLRKPWRNMVFEFSKGYEAALSPEGIRLREVQIPFLACGLAALFKPGAKKTIMNYGHHKLHETMPTLIDPGMPMYIRAVHADNDSQASDRQDKPQPATREQLDLLRAKFNVDEAQVKAVFGAQAVLRDTA